ncbi:MAG: sodium:alanine symporter family protein [Candidatus Saccharicenans sp.]|nr:sodium:alanine symporter family protein [Candidatus Saccharicenans sp.]
MEGFLANLSHWVDKTAYNIWSVLLFFLLAAGIWLTIRTGFVQFRHLGDAFRIMFAGLLHKGKKEKREGDVSAFQALSTALAATVGNGNIGGVAFALTTGGPGAIFWLWVCGFLGMATKYSEALLGVKFREHYPDGKIAGGPMYYIKNGFSNKKFAAILAPAFAICGALATLFGTGNMMQANQMTMVFNSQFGIPKIVSAVVITLFVSIVIIGGIKRIGAVAERVVPVMIFLYIIVGTYVILSNVSVLPKVFALIFTHAFKPYAVAGGAIGYTVKMAMQMGFRRGLLTNEAGLGSAPIAHAAAQTKSPVHQGLMGVAEVFVDTIVVCSFTALINLSTGLWQAKKAADAIQGTALTASSFASEAGIIGSITVAIGSFLFGYTTLIGWYYYGEQCMKFIFGQRITQIYRVIYIALGFIGALVSIQIVFYVGDIANALMAIPNLVALFVLSGIVARTSQEFWRKYRTLEDFDKAQAVESLAEKP